MAPVEHTQSANLVLPLRAEHPGPPSDLQELLHRTFGHREFRPHQQAVCEAAAEGKDVLLVMPTGAGKSLCYQLPALARNGTALVISPLIALMEDQAAKLAALNLRVGRIHSGLSRDDARAAARAYLEGRLDFLFIAPERLRVPGFPEMLARRKPSLIAIDEAHCISQWGHDFRPDYRTLGQFLPALRPSPVIALTATATPAVQQDIVRALQLRDAAIFITGFRRTNLHIEVAEVSKPQRVGTMRKLLSSPSARPAIIYAQSRKAAEEIAIALGQGFPAAPYHAGLDAATRDRVQRAFLSGQLGVVVATVAFGMGVDKADVRTVIHAALPGSVEGYYQEIGRAGRDGAPSRAVLLHNFADRRTQEFLLEKSYPAVSDIERVLGALAAGTTTLPELAQQLKMERELLEQSIDKLLIQGAIRADLDGSVHPAGNSGWKHNYEQQLQYRRAQIDKIVAYTEGSGCRMAALVQHFGDRSDAGRPCGVCDVCRPEGAGTVAARQPDASERAQMQEILRSLTSSGRSAGKVFTQLGWKDRKHFDGLVDGLAKAGLVAVGTDSFRAEDGREISYRKLSLTHDGEQADEPALLTVWLRLMPGTGQPEKGRRRASSPGKRGERSSEQANADLTPEAAMLEARLREWRFATARASGHPAFTIFHDSVLRALAQNPPRNVAELESFRGIGQEKSNRYGADLLAICGGREPGTGLPRPAPKNGPAPSGREEKPARASEARRQTTPPATALPAPSRASSAMATPAQPSPAQQHLEAALRTWRGEQAASEGLPSFFVLSDTALRIIASAQPQDLVALRQIPGLNADKLERYGAAVLKLCRL